MIAILDVDYRGTQAQAACVLADGWAVSSPLREVVATVSEVAPYQPGAFFLRELPCLLAVLARLETSPGLIIIDGYVWLDAQHRPGLGAHLFDAVEKLIPIVGVAKHAFAGSPHAVAVRRGASINPLYVTAVGIDASAAAEQVRAMHGEYRLPTLIKRADALARS